jgi:membrane-associated phospholipid phosphatase
MIRDPTSLYDGEPSPGVRKAARIISALGSPFVLSAFCFIALGIRAGDATRCAETVAVCLLFAVILPLAIVTRYSLKFNNKDGDIERREDRKKPLLAGVLCYLICLALLYALNGADLLTVMLLCYMVSTALVGIVSLRWKISVHATGVVGPSIGMAVAYPPYGGLLILLLPMVAWSRYVQRKHTPMQLLAGAALGAVVTLTLFRLLLRSDRSS